jgi:hypothetical protein
LFTTTAPELDALTGIDRAPARTAPASHRPIAKTDEQPILSIRAAVAEKDAERFIADALHDIRVFMRQHDVLPDGPPFSISRPREGILDIEAGWPTATRPLVGAGRIHSGSVPRSSIRPRGLTARE